MNIKFKT